MIFNIQKADNADLWRVVYSYDDGKTWNPINKRHTEHSTLSGAKIAMKSAEGNEKRRIKREERIWDLI